MKKKSKLISSIFLGICLGHQLCSAQEFQGTLTGNDITLSNGDKVKVSGPSGINLGPESEGNLTITGAAIINVNYNYNTGLQITSGIVNNSTNSTLNLGNSTQISVTNTLANAIGINLSANATIGNTNQLAIQVRGGRTALGIGDYMSNSINNNINLGKGSSIDITNIAQNPESYGISLRSSALTAEDLKINITHDTKTSPAYNGAYGIYLVGSHQGESSSTVNLTGNSIIDVSMGGIYTSNGIYLRPRTSLTAENIQIFANGDAIATDSPNDNASVTIGSGSYIESINGAATFMTGGDITAAETTFIAASIGLYASYGAKMTINEGSTVISKDVGVMAQTGDGPPPNIDFLGSPSKRNKITAGYGQYNYGAVVASDPKVIIKLTNTDIDNTISFDATGKIYTTTNGIYSLNSATINVDDSTLILRDVPNAVYAYNNATVNLTNIDITNTITSNPTPSSDGNIPVFRGIVSQGNSLVNVTDSTLIMSNTPDSTPSTTALYGLNASTGGIIDLSGNLVLKTGDEEGTGILAWSHGVNSEITGTGKFTMLGSLYARQRIIGPDEDGKDIIEDGGTIKLTLNEGSSLTGGLEADTGGKITLSGTSVLKTGDDSGMGILALADGTDTEISANGKFTMVGSLYAQNNGLIDLTLTEGSTWLGKPVAVTGGKVKLSGTFVSTSGDDSGTGVLAVADGAGSEISGTGKFTMVGSLYANNGGTIKLVLTEGSFWQGDAFESNGGNVQVDITNSTYSIVKPGPPTITNMNELTLNNGIVDIRVIPTTPVTRRLAFRNAWGTRSSDPAYNILTIENLFGNGSFIMNSDVQAMQGDLLQVTGSSSGSHQILLNNDGSADVNGTERLTLVETADGVADFSLSSPLELGGYQYNLRKNPDHLSNWELYGTPNRSKPADASVNIFSGNYLLNYAEMNTLTQRLGELRSGEYKDNIWLRTYGGKFTSNSNSFIRPYNMKYSGIQMGADKKLAAIDDSGSWHIGAMLGYSKGNLDYGYGSGSISSSAFGIYGTYTNKDNLYLDAVIKYNWLQDNFKVLDSDKDLVTGSSINQNGLSASLEVGKRYILKSSDAKDLYIEPQVQIIAGHYQGNSFTASNGLRVNMDSYNSLIGRLGANVGYSIKNAKNPINIYAKLSYVREFNGDISYYLNNSKEYSSYGNSWWVYGLGVTTEINKVHSLYFDIERSTGGKFTQSWALNAGYRFSW